MLTTRVYIALDLALGGQARKIDYLWREKDRLRWLESLTNACVTMLKTPAEVFVLLNGGVLVINSKGECQFCPRLLPNRGLPDRR